MLALPCPTPSLAIERSSIAPSNVGQGTWNALTIMPISIHIDDVRLNTSAHLNNFKFQIF